MTSDNIRIINDIKNMINSECEKFKYKFNDTDNREELSRYLNEKIKELKEKGQLNKFITVEVVPTDVLHVCNIEFWYKRRKLLINNLEDLLRFNKSDYYYIDDDQIYHETLIWKI